VAQAAGPGDAWYGWRVDPSPPSPAADAAVEVVADTDGARAARRAIARSGRGRTAVWVGAEDDPELRELRTEIGAPT
jgi:hypothetical protein